MKPRSLFVLTTTLTLAMGCPDPVYDDDLGIESVPVEEGALAGTFGYKSVSALILTVEVPGLEDSYAGTENHRLVVRTWDAETQTYEQTTRLCGGEEYPVAGVEQSIPQSTWRAVPESTGEVVTVNHGRGEFVVRDQVQVWGANLPDPVTTALPADSEEAEQPPHADRIYDMDEDGNPGYTLTFSGFFNGKLYSIQRRIIELDGITLGPDRVLGLVRTSYETVGLGGEFPDAEPREDAGPPDDESEARGPPLDVHPDPKESWFEEVRIPDGSTCDDVMSLEDEGTISRIRPF